eukprot:525274_1
MALTSVPKALYKRLLRASTIIDNTKNQLPFQSLLCGKPSTLYSYELKECIDIGSESYSLYDRFVSIMNDGEYSSPVGSHPISFYSIVRNTARLCSKNPNITGKKKSKFSRFSKQGLDIPLTESELIEIVTNLESLASIANKYNKLVQVDNIMTDTNCNSSTNTFQCDIIDWNNKQFTDKDVQKQIINLILNKNINTENKELVKLMSKKQKKILPIFEYKPKTLQTQNDNKVSMWRNSILFQHPLSAISAINNNNECNTEIEPYVLLGLFAHASHYRLNLSGKKDKDNNNIRISLIMNGEKTLIPIGDIIDERKILSTFHGTQTIPDTFYENNVFIGGDDLSTIEILTNNPYCKGVGIMNNKLFWNPDLLIADRIIQSGYGTPDQFRFFKGKMKWNSDLWNNIQDRNLYTLLSTSLNTSSSWNQLTKQIWSYQINNDSNDND